MPFECGVAPNREPQTRDEFCRAGRSLGRATERDPLSLRPLPEPAVAVLVVAGSTTGPDRRGLSERVRALLDEVDAEVVVFDMSRVVEPDLGTVDSLARAQLTARRLGREVRLAGASPALQRLLELAGLAEVVPLGPELCLGRPLGQAEEREQRLGVEEGGEPDDAAV